MVEQKKVSEIELLMQYKTAKENLERLSDEKTAAQVIYDQAEERLVTYLEDQDKTATARYDGVGFVSLVKPRVYASFDPTEKLSVFKFLRDRKRQDLIQKTVNSNSLSTFIKELLEAGRKVPPCISYYLKKGTRLTKG